MDSKSYIGQSINCFNQRYKGGKWWNSTHNVILLNSIKKYGLESFKYEIIEDGIESIDKLNELEIYYAQKFNSYRPYGYNIRGCGGNKFLDEGQKFHLSTFRKGTRYIPKNKKSSKFKGVCWKDAKKSWQVNFENMQIRKTKYCNSEIEAAETYDKVSLYLYGNKSFINFEDKRSEYLSLDLEKFYNDFLYVKKKNRKHPIIDDSSILNLIKPLIWKMSIPEMSKKLNLTIRKINYCIKKNKLESPGKNYWQKIRNKHDKK